VQERFSIGGAYRDTTTNRLNLLTRYEFRIENTSLLSGAPGLSLGATTDRRVQIVSTHVDVHPVRAWTFSGQHAAKFVDDRAEASAGRFGIHLVSVSSNFTTRGVFVRIRMKFDESIVPGLAPDAR
jgi:hypothetical protein